MLLAAGEGKRLLPLTAYLPKALAPVLGIPMLERLLAWLARGGVEEAALNAYHLAERLRTHVQQHEAALALQPRIYEEPRLLGTGGGLAQIEAFWGQAPLIVWNADILCAVSPVALHKQLLQTATEHAETVALLVVQQRRSAAQLLVDSTGKLCGIDAPQRGPQRLVVPAESVCEARLRRVAYNGIACLHPALRRWLPAPGEAGDFIDALLQAAAAGVRVATWDVGQAFFGATDTQDRLAALEHGLRQQPALLRAWTPSA